MTADLAPLAVVRPATQPAGPWIVARRYLALAAVAIALATVHVRHRPSTICPFRAVTGLPCPFCGGTTAATELGGGHLRGALAASPLAVGLLVTWPWLGVVAKPRWLAVGRRGLLVMAGVLLFAELWQLVRFGIVPNPF